MSYVLKALSNFIHESVLKTDRHESVLKTDRPTDQVSPRSDFPSLKNLPVTTIVLTFYNRQIFYELLKLKTFFEGAAIAERSYKRLGHTVRHLSYA